MIRARRRSRCNAVVLVLALVALVEGAGSAPAAAIDPSRGRPGFCPDDRGVTVVVDFQQLGGETYVRCFPDAGRGTGLDTLRGAGFQMEGVRRWGESFVCRIENRPSAVERVPIDGDPTYTEQCIDTPPAAGYWSYWYAGNGCPWRYSQWGVKNREFLQGGFEGWSFSLNASADANPVPRVAPVRPGTEGDGCATARPPKGPDAAPPDPAAPRGTGTGTGGPSAPTDGSGAAPAPHVDDPAPTGSPTDGDGSAGAAPADTTTTEAEGTPASSTTVAFSGGEDAPDVRTLVRDQQGGSRWAPWAAGGAAVVLAAAALRTDRRRRLARER